MATLLTQTYNLNLIPGQNIVVVNVAAYDNSPRLIRFNMFNGAVAADVSGWSARVEGTRQGTKVGFSTVCTVASPVVSFAITNAMTASSGKHQAAVVFYQGEKRVASATFILNVAPAVLDESTPATEEDTTIYQQWLAANTSQIQTNTNDIAVLKSRMDEFASLPDGSTTGDAELVDIRVGAGGETYPTAGDAVRNQVTDLKTDFNEALNGVENVNLFVPADATDGQSLIYNGNTTTSANMFVSDYIEVDPNAEYTYSTGTTGVFRIASYDSTKTFISGSWQTSGRTYTTKGTAKYIRFSDYLEFKSVASFGRQAITGVYDLIDETNDSIDAVAEYAATTSLSISNIAETYYGKSEIDVSSYIVNKMYRINNGVLQSVTSTGYDSVVLPCNPNDVFFVSSVVAQADVLYLAIFCDQNMGLISGYKQGTASSRTTYVQEKVVIPRGCNNVIFTSYGATAEVYEIDPSIVLYQQNFDTVIPSCKAKYIDEFNGQERDSMLGTYAKLVAGNLKWTILGDSITDTWDGHAQAGGGASDAAHGYAKIVARWLSTKYGNGLTFVNNGTGGITASGSIPKVADYLEGNGFDLIVVALGTNDWNVQTSLANFKTNYNSLLDEIESRCPNAEIAIIGLGYFDGWKPEKVIREDNYNEVLYSIAKTRNLRFVCPYLEMENAIKNGGYSFADITYASDPVHPNDTGHRIWADTAYKLFDIL